MSTDDDKPSKASKQESETFDAFLRDVARSEPREPPSKDDLVGSTLGHYRVLAELGRGGMGIVYRAEDARLSRDVALKVLPASYAGDEERRRRFLREARSAAAINHANIATVYEVGEVDGRLFLAMERVEGSTLRARLTEGPLAQVEALRITRQIALGLARAHEKGIVHRDLKPENVMLTRDGDVKILDFGLAKLREPISTDDAPPSGSTLTQEGRVMGTPGYMSPEQATGKRVDVRTDVYALGVVLHEMLTGELPGALGSGRVAGDARVAAIVAKCLARAAEERWGSAEEVVGAIDALGTKRGSAPWRRWTFRRVAFAVATTTALLNGGVFIERALEHRAQPAAVAASASAQVGAHAIGLLDVPPPVTKSPEALAAYRGAMADIRDAVRRPLTPLRRAVQLDPEFAAAYLRLAFGLTQSASTLYYGSAVRFRASLDARDLELLHAEEPLETSSPPDLVEAERRYAALHEKWPLDVEVLLQLARVRLERDPSSARATYQELMALDPTMAGGELGLGITEGRAGNEEAALAHYTQCLKISPTAGRCIVAIADMNAARGKCDECLALLGRASLVDLDDYHLRSHILNATLGAGRSYDEAQAALRATIPTLNAPPLYNAATEGNFRAGMALWFGSFAEARETFSQVNADYIRSGETGLLLEQRLGIAEEIGDEAEAISVVKEVIGARAGRAMDSEDDGYEEVILQAVREHRVMPPSAAMRLRERWTKESSAVGFPSWKAWLYFDAAQATTVEEARAALASGNDSAVPLHAGARVNAQLGRVLLLAGRYADAAPRLELAAFSCLPYPVSDADSDMILIVRAALDLGRAREALGDTPAACAAYQRVLDRWGHATPRSITADAARAATKRLHCAD